MQGSKPQNERNPYTHTTAHVSKLSCGMQGSKPQNERNPYTHTTAHVSKLSCGMQGSKPQNIYIALNYLIVGFCSKVTSLYNVLGIGSNC